MSGTGRAPEPVVAIVVVAFNTQAETLLSNLNPLCPGNDVIVVDNSDDPRASIELKTATEAAGWLYLSQGGNVGIARAQNQGVSAALKLNALYILLLDDDSLLEPHALGAMVRFLAEAPDDSLAVGPRIFDQASEISLAFKWTRRGLRLFTEEEFRDHQSLEAAFLLGSGSLVRAHSFADVGLLRDEFFIDHVDLEWGLRARRHGKTLWVLSDAVMHHTLGDAPRGGKRKVPAHVNPVRSYYQVRNLLLMARDGGKGAAIVRPVLVRMAAKTLLRAARLSLPHFEFALRGLGDGLRGRGGPMLTHKPFRRQ